MIVDCVYMQYNNSLTWPDHLLSEEEFQVLKKHMKTSLAVIKTRLFLSKERLWPHETSIHDMTLNKTNSKPYIRSL